MLIGFFCIIIYRLKQLLTQDIVFYQNDPII